jgi:hypothetical protein
MKNRNSVTLSSMLLLMVSSQVLAHNVETGGGLFSGLMHMFTGEHVLMIFLAGVCAAGLTRLYRRFHQ